MRIHDSKNQKVEIRRRIENANKYQEKNQKLDAVGISGYFRK